MSITPKHAVLLSYSESGFLLFVVSCGILDFKHSARVLARNDSVFEYSGLISRCSYARLDSVLTALH